MKLGLALALAASMSADAGIVGWGGTSWQEEIQLHDGGKIVVTRVVERGGRHEVGQEPPIKEQRLSFILPGTNENVTWEDKFTEDLGGASFLPMLLDVRKGLAYLIAHPMGCLSYNKWGRPNPPYVVFKYHAKVWQRITLKDLPAEIKTPNLIFSSPDREAAKRGRIVSAEAINSLYEGYKQPEYKSILREEVMTGDARTCPQMIRTKDGWEGAGFFKYQPSREACLKYCDRKGVNKADCPCEIIFKGDK